MQSSAVRPVLWFLLALAVSGNVAAAGRHPVANVAFGVLVVALGVALAVHHYRYRRPH